MPYDFYSPNTRDLIEEIMRGLSGGQTNGGDWLNQILQGGEQLEPPDGKRMADEATLHGINEERQKAEQQAILQQQAAEQEAARQAEVARQEAIQAALAQQQQSFGNPQVAANQAGTSPELRAAIAATTGGSDLPTDDYNPVTRQDWDDTNHPYPLERLAKKIASAGSNAGAGSGTSDNKQANEAQSETPQPEQQPVEQPQGTQQPAPQMPTASDTQAIEKNFQDEAARTLEEAKEAVTKQMGTGEQTQAETVRSLFGQTPPQREREQLPNNQRRWDDTNNPMNPFVSPTRLTQQSAEIYREVLEAKEIYDHAEDYANAYNENPNNKANNRTTTADKIREEAHKLAETARMKAEAAGIDLGMVGTEGTDVNLETAINNLVKQQVRDRASFGQGGAYGMSSDQYYKDRYNYFIGQGYSAREARNMAANQTQDYDFNKSAALQDFYDVYGLTDNYTNKEGNFALRALGQLDPTAASIIMGLYPSFKEGVDRSEARLDNAMAHYNELEKLGYTGLLNLIHQNRGELLRRETHAINKGVDFAYEQEGKDNDEVRARDRTQWNFAESLRQDEIKFNQLIARINAIPDEGMRKSALAAAYGIRNSSGTGKDTLTNVKIIADMINNQIKTLQARQKAIVDGLPDTTDETGFAVKSKLSDDINKDARAQYDAIQQQIDEYTQEYGDIIGAAEGLVFPKVGVTPYSEDDEQGNLAAAKVIIQPAGNDYEAALRALTNWISNNGQEDRIKAGFKAMQILNQLGFTKQK